MTEGSQTAGRSRWLLVGAVGTLLVAVAVTLLVVFLDRDSVSPNADSNFVPFIPIFAGAWIPIWAASKEKPTLDKRSKYLLFGLVGLTALLVGVTLLFAFLPK